MTDRLLERLLHFVRKNVNNRNFFSRFTFHLSPRKAFTIAELIIVIGIIGIVAEMTIPSLVSDFQKNSYKAAAKEAYSKASQAFNQMKLDNGNDLSYYYNTKDSFNSEFRKYFKVVNTCPGANNACVAPSFASTQYKSLTKVPAYTFYMTPDSGRFVTSDGMYWGICNNHSALCPKAIKITVDVNGYTKPPNVFGEDTFMFDVVNDNLKPMGALGTTLLGTNASNTGSKCCNRSGETCGMGGMQGLGCMSNVMQGIDY